MIEVVLGNGMRPWNRSVYFIWQSASWILRDHRKHTQQFLGYIISRFKIKYRKVVPFCNYFFFLRYALTFPSFRASIVLLESGNVLVLIQICLSIASRTRMFVRGWRSIWAQTWCGSRTRLTWPTWRIGYEQSTRKASTNESLLGS